MSSGVDLRQLLESWPYDPDDNVRQVRAGDGREILQVRLPLGIEQYELEDRPDGKRPHGAASFFDFHLARLEKARRAGGEKGFTLSHEQCEELFNEGTLYYYRYLNLFQVKDWVRTSRDTARNLRLFDFVNQYAEREADQLYLEQWRPYLLRMHGVARAMSELDRGAHAPALKILRETLEMLEALPEMSNETFKFERERSLGALREMLEEIGRTRPLSEEEALERELERAIEEQAFERAAELRDRLRELRKK